MSKPRYIAHTSGKQPVGNNQFVDIVFSNGSVNETQRAGDWGPALGFVTNWWEGTQLVRLKIIAYRVIS